jgi:hypothetical protein
MNELRHPDLPHTGKRCAGKAPRPDTTNGTPVSAAETVKAPKTYPAEEAEKLTEKTTRAVSGKPASASRVGEANIARHVYELWDNAGALLACAEALYEQGARRPGRLARVERGGVGSVRVAPVEDTGLVRVGASVGWGDEIGDAGHG